MKQPLLRSRVARRILTAFVVSALVPLVGIAVVSLAEVRDQLRENAFRQLRHDTKSWALGILERLQWLEVRVRLAAAAARSERRGGDPSNVVLPPDIGTAVSALTRLDEDGQATTLLGRPVALPPGARPGGVTAERSVLHLAGGREATRVLLEVRDGSETLFGEIDPDWLWGLVNLSDLPSGTDVTVLDLQGDVLATSLSSRPGFVPEAVSEVSQSSAGRFVWRDRDRDYLASYRVLPLLAYQAPSVVVVLTLPLDDVLAPAAAFSRAFLLTLLLTLLLVVLFSLRLVRQSLHPLEELREATRRIGERDFSTHVEVSSGDEFQELAAAFNTMAERLRDQFDELESLQLGTLRALARTIDAKSPWTMGHSERVTQMALEIGREMGLDERALTSLYRGGLLHDIGKLAIPGAILDKDGPLTPDEMRTMREHPLRGVRILEPIAQYRGALHVVAQHHEWFNGEGYPRGLAGEEIDLGARILAVADVFDALTSERPYRPGLDVDAAVSFVRERAGTQFDPAVVEAFLRVAGRRADAAA
jgi:putative nucleotidyltransferase with HDIG domain